MKLLNTLLCAAAPVLAIWPIPESIKTGEDTLWIGNDVDVTYNGRSLRWQFDWHHHGKHALTSDSVITGAVSRAMDNIVNNGFVPWSLYERNALATKEPKASSSDTFVKSIDIIQKGNGTQADGSVDESYSLKVSSEGEAEIQAATAVGVMHALETFTQLWFKHSTSGDVYTNMAPVEIQDKPQYQHRGVLFDASRSFFPVKAILRTIDALAQNKLNRLHLHATDSQSWPLEIPAMPELSEKGAYSPAAVYTADDLKMMQEYGAARGVEVYVEIDTPGHFGSLALSHPELTAAWQAWPWSQYCAEPPCGQLRLDEPKVDEFLDTLMDDLLPRTKPYSTLHHAGGDEVNYNAIALDPSVGTNDTKVIEPLMQKFYDRHFARIQKAGMTPVVWEEVILGYHVEMSKDVIVQSWLGGDALDTITKRGYRAIASDYNYLYMDCGRGAWINFGPEDFEAGYPFQDWCSPAKSWRLVYSYNPRANLTEEQQKLVIGGEAPAWSEYIDEVNLDSVFWPRTSALGETLWSGAVDAQGQNRSQIEAAPRLAEFRERMVARGIGSSSVYMPYCTQGMNGTACANA